MTTRNTRPRQETGRGETFPDSWLAYEQVRGMMAALEDHTRALISRGAAQMTDTDRRFIETSVQTLTDVVFEGIGRYGITVPAFKTEQDQTIVREVVKAAYMIESLEPGQGKRTFVAPEELTEGSTGWIRLGAVMAHDPAKSLDLKAKPYLLAPMQDYALNMSAVVDRFGMANNGLPVSGGSTQQLHTLTSLIR
ncbi:MAG: hypothetical protein WD887_01335 [Candidatus Saccharimonadales bacterium]